MRWDINNVELHLSACPLLFVNLCPHLLFKGWTYFIFSQCAGKSGNKNELQLPDSGRSKQTLSIATISSPALSMSTARASASMQTPPSTFLPTVPITPTSRPCTPRPDKQMGHFAGTAAAVIGKKMGSSSGNILPQRGIQTGWLGHISHVLYVPQTICLKLRFWTPGVSWPGPPPPSLRWNYKPGPTIRGSEVTWDHGY